MGSSYCTDVQADLHLCCSHASSLVKCTKATSSHAYGTKWTKYPWLGKDGSHITNIVFS